MAIFATARDQLLVKSYQTEFFSLPGTLEERQGTLKIKEEGAELRGHFYNRKFDVMHGYFYWISVL